jgi:hypothetical protein
MIGKVVKEASEPLKTKLERNFKIFLVVMWVIEQR